MSVTVGTVAAAFIGLATVVALWRLYSAARATAREHDTRASGGPYALMVAGAVAAAIGAVLAAARPWDAAGAAAIATVLGGPALFLVGDLVFNRAVTGRVPASRVAALAALAVIALIGFVLPVLVLAALAFAVLLLLSLSAAGWFRLPSLNVQD
ncbi:low temperature requirement protein A [Glycomyces harbinensis]|uniref:Low temperature requirement A protein (LtrA) n=1 Tax=Glycomyces harbinensis TaxID=58114 RepID=A0A1G6V4P7_9ACTN|nr:low temperature requirement protein A [Glycomyces harbinensis]SDD48629.1 low temperature requirement A protein (LtrA) [Glycomyces harbinensis]